MSEAIPRKIVLKGKKVIGGVAEGEALVSPRPLMGWGMVNEKMGFTTEKGHPLYEVPIKGKVLVFPTMRGSGGFVMYGRTRKYDAHPVAMVYNKGNSVVIFAAMNAKVPTVAELDQDVTAVIETGDWVRVDGDNGIVEITKRS